MKSNHVISSNRMMEGVWNHCRTCAWILVLMLFLTACGGTSVPAWQEQYDLGMQYLMDGDYEAAVVAFTASIETGPKLAALYIARGDAYSAWAEETEAAALEALAGGETLEWSEITVSADDGSTYTLEELYENAISNYEEAISLLESGEALDDSQDELLEEAEEKRQETEDRLEKSREEYTEKWNELNSADDEADAQKDGTGNSEEEESEITDESSVIYQNYEDCSEEEQSVITMLVDAAESGDLDSLPLLSEIPEINGYYYDDGYRVHITRWYETSGYDEYHGIEGYRSYMIVSVRPQSGMGYAYYIYESLDIAELNKRGNYDLDYCFRKTDYIACPCEDWNWNGEYTEIYIYNRLVLGNEYSGYETGSVTDNLLNGTISTTYTTPDAVYTWTRIYEDEIIVDRSGTEGEWSTQYVYSQQSGIEYIKKYFWLDEAYEAYHITRIYDSNDNLTAKYIRNSADVLVWYRKYRYDEDGNYQGYDEYDGKGKLQSSVSAG